MQAQASEPIQHGTVSPEQSAHPHASARSAWNSIVAWINKHEGLGVALGIAVGVIAVYGRQAMTVALGVVLFIAAIGFMIALTVMRRWAWAAALSGSIVIALLVSTAAVVWPRDKLDVDITNLQDDNRVETDFDYTEGENLVSTFRVRGTAAGLEPGQWVYVVSEDVERNRWWPFQAVVDDDGSWEAVVYVGHACIGKIGYLRAIIADRSAVDSLRPSSTGELYEDDYSELDPAAESEVIKVTVGKVLEAPGPVSECPGGS